MLGISALDCIWPLGSHEFLWEVSKYDSLYILLEQRGKVCRQLPIGWQKANRRTAL